MPGSINPPFRGPQRSCTARWITICSVAAYSALAAAADESFDPPAEPLRLAAIPAPAAPVVDGRLDEAIWNEAPVAASFRQIDPVALAPATQDTEVRVVFDGDHLFFGVRCRDAAGKAGIRVQDLRRDFDHYANDVFGISLDPFLDGRTAQAFEVTPAGSQRDMRVTDGRAVDADWDAPWSVRAQANEDGWTAEIAIPWSVLRYPAESAEWGINFVRRVRRLEELSGWSPWPRGFTPYRMTYAGRLEGLRPPAPRRQLRLRPYVLARGVEVAGRGERRRESELEAGGELRWLPNPSTVVELTANTDFAETDSDRQVVNLSRFSPFFPEKRQFFLENARLFDSGFESIKPFFSRRIGLDDQGRRVPIEGGLRLVHQDARQAAGGLVLRTGGAGGGAAASTFALGRYQRNLGERHRLGALVVGRRDEAGHGRQERENLVGMVDGLYRPNELFTFQGFLSGSSSSGVGGDGLAGSLWAYSEGPRGYFGWLQRFVSPDYEASAGFVDFKNYVLTSPAATFEIQSPSYLPKAVRRLKPNVSANFFHTYDGLELIEGSARLEPLWVVFQDGSEVYAWWQPNWQRLAASFSPVPGIAIAPGSYEYDRFGAAFSTDKSRKWSLEMRYQWGGYFDGSLETNEVTLRLAPSPRLSLIVDFVVNDLQELGPGRHSREVWLWRPELRLAIDPRKQLTVFYQRNAATETEAYYARLSWELRPLSFLHVVLGDFSPTDPGAGHLLRSHETQRQAIVKLGWSFGS